MPSSPGASVGAIGIGRRSAESGRRRRTAAPRRRRGRSPMPTSGDEHDLRRGRWRTTCAARRAEALQRGDRGALAVDEAAHRIGDADAADQEGGQADQGEELGEALDVAGKARIGVERACGSPSRPRAAPRAGLGVDAVEGRVVGRAGRQGQRGRSSARGCRAGAGRSPASASCETRRRGPKPMPLAILSGSETRLRPELRRGRRRRVIAVADLEIEAGEQARVGDGAEDAVALARAGRRAAAADRSTRVPTLG